MTSLNIICLDKGTLCIKFKLHITVQFLLIWVCETELLKIWEEIFCKVAEEHSATLGALRVSYGLKQWCSFSGPVNAGSWHSCIIIRFLLFYKANMHVDIVWYWNGNFLVEILYRYLQDVWRLLIGKFWYFHECYVAIFLWYWHHFSGAKMVTLCLPLRWKGCTNLSRCLLRCCF